MKRRAEKVKVIGGQMNGSSSWNRRQKKHDGGVRKIEKGVKEEQELLMGRRGVGLRRTSRKYDKEMVGPRRKQCQRPYGTKN